MGRAGPVGPTQPNPGPAHQRHHSVDPDVAPRAEPLVDSSPGTAAATAAAAAAAAAAGAGVEVVSAPNREGTRDPMILRHISFRRRI